MKMARNVTVFAKACMATLLGSVLAISNAGAAEIPAADAQAAAYDIVCWKLGDGVYGCCTANFCWVEDSRRQV